jgi:hypothetical protein
MRAAEVQVGQDFGWHAIQHTLLEVIQPDVTHVSARGATPRRCRFVKTGSRQLGETSWLLPDDDEVTILDEEGGQR